MEIQGKLTSMLWVCNCCTERWICSYITGQYFPFLVGLVLMTLVFVILHGHAALIGRKLGMMVRIFTTAAIYQKVKLVLLMLWFVGVLKWRGWYCHVMYSSCCALDKQILTLSQVTVGQISVGRVVNLASNDVQKFDNVSH